MPFSVFPWLISPSGKRPLQTLVHPFDYAVLRYGHDVSAEHARDKILPMKKWQFWIGVLISIVFIWLALRGMRLDEFWGAVKQANYVWLVPGIAALPKRCSRLQRSDTWATIFIPPAREKCYAP